MHVIQSCPSNSGLSGLQNGRSFGNDPHISKTKLTNQIRSIKIILQYSSVSRHSPLGVGFGAKKPILLSASELAIKITNSEIISE